MHNRNSGAIKGGGEAERGEPWGDTLRLENHPLSLSLSLSHTPTPIIRSEVRLARRRAKRPRCIPSPPFLHRERSYLTSLPLLLPLLLVCWGGNGGGFPLPPLSLSLSAAATMHPLPFTLPKQWASEIQGRRSGAVLSLPSPSSVFTPPLPYAMSH